MTPENIHEHLDGFDLILDGTDNFETRFLLNDFAVSNLVPWIYAAAVGSYGLTFTIRPENTACLACLLETADASHDGASIFDETCDTIGVLGPAVSLIASLETAEALKILCGEPEALHNRLLSCDVWSGRMQSIAVSRNRECRACVHHEFSYLHAESQPHITMCGRDSVQIHERRRALDLPALARRLSGAGIPVQNNDFLIKFAVPPYQMTVFGDGRAILKGSTEPAVARSLYARYIGA